LAMRSRYPRAASAYPVNGCSALPSPGGIGRVCSSRPLAAGRISPAGRATALITAALMVLAVLATELALAPAAAAATRLVTAYVTDFDGFVTPIPVITNKPGTPIPTGGDNPEAIAITPDGKTAYVVNTGSSEDVTPITLATNKPGTPIHAGGS